MRSKSPRSSFRNLKLTLEYDGTRFFGFQRQNHQPTIQSELEKALSQLFNRRMKISAAAGRTDSDVHAKAQVVNFKISSPLPLQKIQKGINALLPHEIAVKKIEEVPAAFHARYSAQSKTYEYRILNSMVRAPLLNGHIYQYPHPLDLKRMKKAAKTLVGRRNFKAFQAFGSSAKTSIRTLRRIKVERAGEILRFVLEADGFLYHMVRNIVGTLLEVGRGRFSVKNFTRLIQSRNRLLAGPTVPSKGLTLVSVNY